MVPGSVQQLPVRFTYGLQLVEVNEITNSRRSSLRQAIHSILITEWDPLGVRDNPLAQDEYDSYVSGIERLLRDANTDAARLCDHLRNPELVSMGLSNPDARRNRQVAARLLALRQS